MKMIGGKSLNYQEKFYSANILNRIFPSSFELLPNTHEVFAVDLAYGEYSSLSPDDLIKRSAFFARINGEQTMHFKLCSGTPLEEIRSGKTIWVKSFFQANRFSTGYATHSLFPYRGKFHPQLIKAILNIIRVKEGETVLDPMGGSGTACIEAQLMNINSIGIDINPFCTLITKAKSYALDVDAQRLKNYADDTTILPFLERLPRVSKNSNIDDFLSNLYISGDEKIDTIFLLSYLDAVGYSKRRKTGSIRGLFSKVLTRYVQTIDSFAKVRNALKIKLGELQAYTWDVLSLNLQDNSVDGIVTSPPYSFAIDYVENDRAQLEFLGIDVDQLKAKMIGLQGKTRQERIQNYFKTMNQAIGEMSRVLKPGKCCVIIVGSNEIQTGGIRHEEEFKKIATKHGLALFKDLVKSIEGIQNSMREEHILFFEKE